MNVYAKIAIVVALLAAVGGVMAYRMHGGGSAGGPGCFTCGPKATATAPAGGADVARGLCDGSSDECRPGGGCGSGGCGSGGGCGQAAGSQPAAPVEAAALPRLVEFGADTCTNCKRMAPIIAKLRSDHAGTLTVEMVNVFDDRDAVEAEDIRSIPTQVFYGPDGKELFRHQGFYSEAEILAKWKELGCDLTPPAK